MNPFSFWWDGLFPVPPTPTPEKKPFDLATMVAEAELRLALQLERDVAAHLRQLRSGSRLRGNGLGVTSGVLTLGGSSTVDYTLTTEVSNKREKEGTLFGMLCLPSRVHPYLRRFIKELE